MNADWLARARRVVSGGASTMSKRAERFVEGAFPVALDHAEGAWVWDREGRRYCDWVCGLGPVTFGHGHPAIREAIERQARDGLCLSLPSPLEVEAAERLIEMGMVPCKPGEAQVRWVSTGTEADMAAVRIARMATGRGVVVQCGYFGWEAWTTAARPEHPGIPRAYEGLVRPFRYNDLESLESSLRPGDVAAVMLEPALFEVPAPGFLQGVIDLAHHYGALACFDEIVLGLRLHLSGGHGFYGVQPDLVTYGKALGQGVPVACVAGPERLMRHAWPISGTFGGNPLAMAVALATLRVYAYSQTTSVHRWRIEECRCNLPVPCDGTAIDHLWEAGRLLEDGFNVAALALGVPARMEGYPVHPRVVFDLPESSPQVGGPSDRVLATSLLLQELAARGVLWHPAGLNTCLAHDAAAVACTLRACRDALVIVQEALEAGDLAGRLRGTPIDTSLAVRADAGHGG